MPKVGKKDQKDDKTQRRTRGRVVPEQSPEKDIKIKRSKKILKKHQKPLILSKEQDHDIIEIEFFEAKQTKKVKKPRFDIRFYPANPDQAFPENLGENMLKVIASFEKNCSIFDIEDNIQKFYTNTVERKAFRKQLKYFEDESIVLERDGAYKVYYKFFPKINLEEEQKQKKQSKQEVKLQTLIVDPSIPQDPTFEQDPDAGERIGSDKPIISDQPHEARGEELSISLEKENQLD